MGIHISNLDGAEQQQQQQCRSSDSARTRSHYSIIPPTPTSSTLTSSPISNPRSRITQYSSGTHYQGPRLPGGEGNQVRDKKQKEARVALSINSLASEGNRSSHVFAPPSRAPSPRATPEGVRHRSRRLPTRYSAVPISPRV